MHYKHVAGACKDSVSTAWTDHPRCHALATLGHIPPKEPWNGQALQVRYQGAPKAVGNYVEIVGLQKLQIQSASLVAIGANPLDFLPTASPSSHHPHRPPGAVNLWSLFPRTYFFLPDTFSRKTFSDRLRTPPLSTQKRITVPIQRAGRLHRASALGTCLRGEPETCKCIPLLVRVATALTGKLPNERQYRNASQPVQAWPTENCPTCQV